MDKSIKDLRASALANLEATFNDLHQAAHAGDGGLSGLMNQVINIAQNFPDGGRELAARLRAQYLSGGTSHVPRTATRINTKAPVYGGVTKAEAKQIELTEQAPAEKRFTAAPYEVGTAGKTSPDVVAGDDPGKDEETPDNQEEEILDDAATGTEGESVEEETPTEKPADVLLEMEDDELREEILEMGAEELSEILSLAQIRSVHERLLGVAPPAKASKIAQVRHMIDLLDD